LPTLGVVGRIANMKAELLLRDRLWLSDAVKVEVVIWRVPNPLPNSLHSFRYRLALVTEGICVMRYDNEAGKGDHKHVVDRETNYNFTDLPTLQADFWTDVKVWRANH